MAEVPGEELIGRVYLIREDDYSQKLENEIRKKNDDYILKFELCERDVRWMLITYKHLLSITEPAYSADDAAKQVEMRFKDDRNFLKICQVKPRQEIFRRISYKEAQIIKNKWFTNFTRLM